MYICLPDLRWRTSSPTDRFDGVCNRSMNISVFISAAMIVRKQLLFSRLSHSSCMRQLLRSLTICFSLLPSAQIPKDADRDANIVMVLKKITMILFLLLDLEQPLLPIHGKRYLSCACIQKIRTPGLSSFTIY